MPEEAKRPSVEMTDEQKLVELQNVITVHSESIDVASVDKLVDKYGAYAYDIVYKALDPARLVEHTDGQYRNTRYAISYLADNDMNAEKLATIVGYDDATKVQEKLNQYEAAKKQKVVDEAYLQVCGGEEKDKVSINDLMKQTGVKGVDFQNVCDEHPELLGEIGGGKSCEALAKAADNVVTKYVGGKAQAGMCKSGVDTIHSNAVKFGLPTDSLHSAASTKAINDYRIERPYQGKSNGGCNIYAGLENSNDYVTVAIKNEAYRKVHGGAEDKKMNELLLQCQPGITVTVDAVEDRKIAQAKTAGGKWGHTVVRANKTKRAGRPWACDFEQGDINFARYGEYAHACFPKDAYVSKDYAKMIIAKAQERQGSENIQANEQINNAVLENTQDTTKVVEEKPAKKTGKTKAKYQPLEMKPIKGLEFEQVEPANVKPVERVEFVAIEVPVLTEEANKKKKKTKKEMKEQKGELVENSPDIRVSGTVALKEGPMYKKVEERAAVEDLSRTDGRPVFEALRDGQSPTFVPVKDENQQSAQEQSSDTEKKPTDSKELLAYLSKKEKQNTSKSSFKFEPIDQKTAEYLRQSRSR